MERLSEGLSDLNTDPGRFSSGVNGLERRIGKIHSNHQRLHLGGVLLPAATTDKEKDSRRHQEDRDDPTFSHITFSLQSSASFQTLGACHPPEGRRTSFTSEGPQVPGL